jgi:toxin secretion/phage lysis holin
MNLEKWIAAALAAVLAFFVSLPAVYWALIGAMALDIVIGTLHAASEGRISSWVAFVGVTKKAAVLIVVGLAALIGHTLAAMIPTDVNIPLGQAVALFYVAGEAISVLEHAAAMGVPVPAFLRRILEGWKEERDDAAH